MNKQGLLITAGGKVTEHTIAVTPEGGGLAGLQAAVKGYIQLVYLADKVCMYMNEEGKLAGLPVNNLATLLIQHYGKDWNDPIAGDVVVIGENKNGNLADLGPIAEIKRVLKTLEAFANNG